MAPDALRRGDSGLAVSVQGRLLSWGVMRQWPFEVRSAAEVRRASPRCQTAAHISSPEPLKQLAVCEPVHTRAARRELACDQLTPRGITCWPNTASRVLGQSGGERARAGYAGSPGASAGGATGMGGEDMLSNHQKALRRRTTTAGSGGIDKPNRHAPARRGRSCAAAASASDTGGV
jgi:hypothetical protein